MRLYSCYQAKIKAGIVVVFIADGIKRELYLDTKLMVL
jgi:hypothetical protein